MIYLVQTDTTAGFLSKDLKALNRVKNRDESKPCLIATAKFSELLSVARVPKKYKNLVRRAKKTTFIYPNGKSVRVVKDDPHAEFLKTHGAMYSTSANLHGAKFDLEYAKSVADEVVGSEFCEKEPSKIYKISRSRVKKIRG
ncbi:MAG: Sua5 YciO YrdC YwlC family protein [Campylobacteraceae bacterium]|nr:Sua5 YciO YrdC YwlC family protein [Campylobacteraceae bacterium]